MNLDTIGCMWTGEFDLNTLRLDGEIFESGKKKLRIKKNQDTCGRGLSFLYEKNSDRDTRERKFKQRRLRRLVKIDFIFYKQNSRFSRSVRYSNRSKNVLQLHGR